MMDYSWLFPFEMIPKGSRVLIYGAGMVGQEYLKQILMTGYCDVVAMADRNANHYSNIKVPVITPDRINEFDVEYAILALRSPVWSKEMKRILVEQGIPEERIVYCGRKKDLSIYDIKDDQVDHIGKLAFEENSISIAFYITGGFGDRIISKKFVDAVIKLCPECVCDIYTSSNEKYMGTIYYGCNNINNFLNNGSGTFQRKRKLYDVALSVHSSFFINVDYISEELEAKAEGLYNTVSKLRELTQKEGVTLDKEEYLIRNRRLYKGKNVYSFLSYDSLLDINNKKVEIQLIPEFKDQYRELKLDKYITVNCGNGNSRDGCDIAKSWPRERIDLFAKLFKSRYNDYKVVQLGDKNAPKLIYADNMFVGEDFGLVEYILKGATFHLDIEGGLVHLATQLGTKCFVLFGPTDEKYYGYDENINISAGKCRNCHGLYADINRCARDLLEPECMYSITPEMVMAYVDEYMKTL